MADNDQKLAYFQEITGIEDVALSHQILEAYDWDLDSAIQAMVEKSTDTFPVYDEPMRSADVPQPSVQANSVDTGPGTSSGAALPNNDPPSAMDMWPPSMPVNEMDRFEDDRSLFERIRDGERVRDETNNGGDGTTSVWRVVTLPFVVLLGSYNLMYGVVGLGLLLAGGLLNRGLGMNNSSWSFVLTLLEFTSSVLNFHWNSCPLVYILLISRVFAVASWSFC